MRKKQNIIPLKELNLTNRFLFDEVMEDAQTHRDVLSIIFGREIPLLEKNQTEKEERITPLIKSIRMDVFAMDEEQTVYNTEMQEKKREDLAKRSRYYQSLVDTGLLEPGVPDYNQLNDSFIIMIMHFDLFGYEKYVYTFESKCKEVPELTLKDGTTRIFLNIKGKNENEVSQELIDFLHYVENTTTEVAENTESERIKRIHGRVCKVKANEEIGVKYMQKWEEEYFMRKEAREEGLAEGRAEGRVEGRVEGYEARLIEQVQKKLAKGKAIEVIADELEETVETIENIIRDMEETEE